MPSPRVQPERLILAGVGIAVMLVLGIFYFSSKAGDEEKAYRAYLRPILTPAADREYQSLWLWERHATARRALPALRKLRATGWGVAATDLRRAGDDRGAYDLVFELKVGDSVLHDCLVRPLKAGRDGACRSFSHVLPDELQEEGAGEQPAMRRQNVPLALYLDGLKGGERPYATTLGKQRLSLADFQLKAQVRVDEEDVQWTDATLLVPDPMAPEKQLAVEVTDFSPRRTLDLRTVKAYTWEVRYPTPEMLAPFLDHAPEMTVLRTDAVVEVSLLRPGYRLEGQLALLNQDIGTAIVEYHPGDYMSVAVQDFSLPAVLPGSCVNIESALLELDVVGQRLRLLGSSRIDTVNSFLCQGGFAEMNPITTLVLGASLSSARDFLGLPESFETHTHLVVDWNDSILCADLGVSGKSFLHAAYMGNRRTFQIWAPMSFTVQEVSGDDLFGNVLEASLNGKGGLPESDPNRCWDEDTGPKTKLEPRLLREQQGAALTNQTTGM